MRWRSVMLAGSLCALLAPASVRAQQAVITGVIRSETQSPVRGAFVSVEGIEGATGVSNDNGNYRIVVPAARVNGQQAKLVVNSIGYRSVEVNFMLRPGAIKQDISMSAEAVALDEVVVTGTAGRQERRAQAAVVASVNAAAITEVSPVTSVSNLLQARTPGVVLRNESGTAGSASTIRIRGASSISLNGGNDPLVFIDGIRMDGGQSQIYGVGGQSGSRLNDIKIEDIESIEIVKGPAAATLYGSDANAGVINIITKRGRTGSGFTQTFTVEYGQANPNFTPPDNYGVCSASAISRPTTYPACQGVAEGTVLMDNPLLRENSFNDGRYRNLTWGLRGGGDRYATFLSLGADDARGTLPNNDYGHINARANFDYFVSEETRLEVGMGIVRTTTQLPINDNNIYGYTGGGFLGDPRTIGAAKDGWYAPNRQTGALSQYENYDKSLRLQPRLSAIYSPTSWFTNRLTFGADMVRTRAYSFWPKNDNQFWDRPELNAGQISERRDSDDRLTFDYLATITRNITSDLRADVSLGSQILTRHSDQTNSTGSGLITNEVRTVNSAAQLVGGGQSSSEDRKVGFFAQAQFSWRDKLFIQAGARRDQESTFGADSKAFYSPKIGASYVISDEPFFRNMFGENVISALRLRAAYGVTGRSPNSGARSTFQPTTNQIDETSVEIGVSPDDVGNPDLRAEKGKELEMGFEAGLFNDRLGLEVTYFNKKTVDQILSLPVAASLGINSPLVNVGSMLNRGFEISANARLITAQKLAWEVRGAFNTLHNEVISLGDAPETQTTRPGFPLSGEWDEKILSVDLENNRVIVTDTPVFLGNDINLPGWEGTLSSTVTVLGGLSFYGQADFRGDVTVYNSTDQFRDRSFGIGGTAVLGCAFYGVDASGNCTDEARTKYMRKFGPWEKESGGSISRNSVRGDYYEDGGFVRLREASVTYRVPRDIVSRFMRAQSAQVTVAMTNLRIWTNYTGLDPETDQFLTVPQDKRWTLRFNFTF
jgi:TonB-dependent starch-binding outer membrane protein SusC